MVLSKDLVPGLKPGDLRAALSGKRAQYAKVFPGFELVADPSKALPTLAGKGVGRIDGMWEVNGVLPLQMAQVWVVGDGVVYTVTLVSLRDTYASHADLFDAMIRSIHAP